MKHLVIYYSHSGKTKIAAEAIAGKLKAELREISEEKKRNGFFVYLIGGFQAINGKCSKIREMDFSTKGFDEITLCTPVWGSSQAPAINSYLSKADLKGKKVNLVITLGGPAPKTAMEKFKIRAESSGAVVNKKLFMSTGLLKREELEKRAKVLSEQFN